MPTHTGVSISGRSVRLTNMIWLTSKRQAPLRASLQAAEQLEIVGLMQPGWQVVRLGGERMLLPVLNSPRSGLCGHSSASGPQIGYGRGAAFGNGGCLACNFTPALEHLLWRGGAGGAELLNSDRGDKVSEGGCFRR